MALPLVPIVAGSLLVGAVLKIRKKIQSNMDYWVKKESELLKEVKEKDKDKQKQ